MFAGWLQTDSLGYIHTVTIFGKHFCFVNLNWDSGFCCIDDKVDDFRKKLWHISWKLLGTICLVGPGEILATRSWDEGGNWESYPISNLIEKEH